MNLFNNPRTLKTVGVVALSLVVSAFIGIGSDLDFAATPKVYKVGDLYTEKGIQAGKKPYVTNLVSKDLTGDGKADTLYVLGDRPEKDAMYYNSFTYVLKDGKSGKLTATALKSIEGYSSWGYEPALEFADLNGDKTQDIAFSSFSGGTGGFTYYDIATFKGGKYKQLLGQKELVGISVTGHYVDGFKAELTSTDLKKTWIQDLSFEKDMLIEMKIYDSNGKLLVPTEAWTGPFVNVKIGEGYVSGVMAIKGIANSDMIGLMHMDYTYTAGKLKLGYVSVETILKGY